MQAHYGIMLDVKVEFCAKMEVLSSTQHLAAARIDHLRFWTALLYLGESKVKDLTVSQVVQVRA